MDFEAMTQAIGEIHRQTQIAAFRAVNVALTCRNWLIGACFHEYELRGQDRAEYGEGLFNRLAQRLAALSVPNCNRSRLYWYRDLYRLYPQIGDALPGAYATLRPPALGAIGDSVATPSPQSPMRKRSPHGQRNCSSYHLYMRSSRRCREDPAAGIYRRCR